MRLREHTLMTADVGTSHVSQVLFLRRPSKGTDANALVGTEQFHWFSTTELRLSAGSSPQTVVHYAHTFFTECVATHITLWLSPCAPQQT